MLRRGNVLLMIPSIAFVAVTVRILCAGNEQGESDNPSPVKQVEPNYAKWRSIKVGMKETEVRRILGNPIEVLPPPLELANHPSAVTMLHYGKVSFQSPAMPVPFYFGIHMLEGRVDEKYDPYDGELSDDGTPTIPKPMCPADSVMFHHEPRFVDLRWRPAAGRHPIRYAVEVEVWNLIINQDGFATEQTHDVEIPYCAVHANGLVNRWRVKAKNDLGESKWSKWMRFRFSK